MHGCVISVRYDQSKKDCWSSDDDEFDSICDESKWKRGTTCVKQVLNGQLERVITNTKKGKDEQTR
jgi:hypothetical protein